MSLNVSEYNNYRLFLSDFYLKKKSEKIGFTYARFAKAAGLGSLNYLKLIIDGTKNITQNNIPRFVKALKLDSQQAEYFEALVYFNQAKKPLEKDYYQLRLQKIKKQILAGVNQRTLEEYEFEFLSSWIHQAIFVLAQTKSFKLDLTWIRKRLFNLADETTIQSALNTLFSAKFLLKSENGTVSACTKMLVTKPELRRLSIKSFYSDLLSRTLKAQELTEPESREFRNSILLLPDSAMPELKKKIRTFTDDLNDWANEFKSPEEVYTIGIYAFPLTQKTTQEKP